MYYRISKNEKILFFGKKNRPGVGSDLKPIGNSNVVELSCTIKTKVSVEEVNSTWYSYIIECTRNPWAKPWWEKKTYELKSLNFEFCCRNFEMRN